MRKKRVNRHSAILRWGSIAAFIFALFAVFGDQGMIKLHQMRQDKAQLEQGIQQIQEESDTVAHEIQNLKDKKYLEKVIREELGFLRPDEVIYYLQPKRHLD